MRFYKFLGNVGVLILLFLNKIIEQIDKVPHHIDMIDDSYELIIYKIYNLIKFR